MNVINGVGGVVMNAGQEPSSCTAAGLEQRKVRSAPHERLRMRMALFGKNEDAAQRADGDQPLSYARTQNVCQNPV